eukprot:scaffold261_cov170-Amphora_coffeaeformis.AAC.4
MEGDRLQPKEGVETNEGKTGPVSKTSLPSSAVRIGIRVLWGPSTREWGPGSREVRPDTDV